MNNRKNTSGGTSSDSNSGRNDNPMPAATCNIGSGTGTSLPRAPTSATASNNPRVISMIPISLFYPGAMGSPPRAAG